MNWQNMYQPNYMYQPQYYQQDQKNIQIQYCDGLEFVKSQNVRMDGIANYYATTNGNEIYCKKLNPQTGTSMIIKYVLDTTPPDETAETEIDRLTREIAELKDIILENLTSPRGGVANE